MSDEKRVNVPKVASTRRPKQKPKLGQHFLVSDNAAMRMADALGNVSQSTVLEIGPGRGVITSLLAKRARRLIAVEIDRVLAAQLHHLRHFVTPVRFRQVLRHYRDDGATGSR